MNSPSLSSPDVLDAGLAAEPLRSLRRGLARTGGFALYVAVFKTPAQRSQLISLLGEAMPGVKLQTVTLGAGSTDILEEVQKQLGGKPGGPVMIVGWEDAVPSDAQNHPILNALNLRRTDWPQFVPHPVVFWVPEYLLGVLARSAPDFLDWRSDTLHFPDVDQAQFRALQSATWSRGLDTQMPAEARLERIKELESRIASNEHSNDRGIRSVVAEWLNELGLLLVLFGKNREAINCFQRVQAITHELGYKSGEGAAFGNLGLICSNLGDVRKAIEFHEHALRLSRETGDLLGESQDIGNLGNAYLYLGEIRKAIELFEQSLKMHRTIGDRRGEAMDLGNLGLAYVELGEPRKASDFYEKQLTITREIGDRRGEASALQNLGNAFADLGDRPKIIELHGQALRVFREIGDRRGEGAALNDLGTVFAEMGDNRKALDLYQQSLAIAREISHRQLEGNALWNMALASNQVGDRSSALSHAEAALQILEAIEDPYAEKVRVGLAELRRHASLPQRAPTN